MGAQDGAFVAESWIGVVRSKVMCGYTIRNVKDIGFDLVLD
jgi:hypothetical protein